MHSRVVAAFGMRCVLLKQLFASVRTKTAGARATSLCGALLTLAVGCSSAKEHRAGQYGDAAVGLASQSLEPLCTFVVHPTQGSDDAGVAGTELAPWRTIGRALSSTSPFQGTGGQTLCLRGGTHNAVQLLDSPSSGTATSPTTIRSYPGERATIDTSLPEFRQTGSGQWVHDSGDVYYSAQAYLSLGRSTHPDPGADSLGGFFRHGDDYFSLVTYRSLDDLRSTSQLYDQASSPETRPGYYAGPGIYWTPGGPIYIRLTRPDAAAVGATYTMPANTNPNQVPLNISYACDPGCVAFGLLGSNILFRDLDLIHGGLAFRNWGDGTDHHLAFQNVRIHAKAGMYLGGSPSNVTIHDSLFDCHLPPWIAANDVKSPPFVALNLGGEALVSNGLSYLFFQNNRVERCFGGIRPLGTAARNSHHLDVLHNEFNGLRADAVQIGTEAYEVEIAYNRFLGGAQALGLRGTAHAPAAGSVFVHHNTMHSRPSFQTRRTPAGAPVAYVTRAPFVAQGQPSVYGGQAPWLIYNNTVIAELGASQSLSTGLGYQYLAQRVSEPTYVHQVLNNVFHVIGNTPIGYGATVSTGQELYDGNLYWRHASGSPTNLLSLMYWDNAQSQSKTFATLDAFRGDAEYWCATQESYQPGWERAGQEIDPRLTYDYTPSFDGPSGSGAVDLSNRGWPGLDGQRYRGAAPVLVDRVIGAWSFESGAVHDSSGYAHTTTALGNATVSGGHTGSGLTLDGIDDGFQVTRAGPLLNLEERSFTFSTWYRGGGTGQVLFSNAGSGANALRIAINNFSPDLVDAQIGAARYYKAGVLPQDGQWHHLMVSVSVRHSRDYRAEFFVDGILRMSESNWISGEKNLKTSPSQHLFIGTAYPGVGEFVGQLDDVRLMRGAHRPDGLIGYFNFDNQFAPGGLDLSGQGSIGTAFGPAAPIDGEMVKCCGSEI